MIYFAVTGTITLNSLGTLPALDSNMKILGAGANALTVKRDPAASAFGSFTVNSGKTVTISDLTISNGSAGSGGGIRNNHGTLTVNNSTVSGNSADAGGGIENFGEDSGSAILTVSNSTLSDNSATNGTGGGIRNTGQFGGSAAVTVNNSTLSGNSANFNGGGNITPLGAGVTVKNSTFSGNSANQGGGIHSSQGTVMIGGTILKAGASGANIVGFAITSLGYNLSSDNGGGFLTATGDQINTDPMLDPNGLQNNGRPTLTIALQPGSPAIDKGKDFTASTTDQRGPGFARTFDNLSIANAAAGTERTSAPSRCKIPRQLSLARPSPASRARARTRRSLPLATTRIRRLL